MFFQDLFIILYWWVVLFLLGLISFPIVFLLFDWLWDRGWGFSKVVGIIFISYWTWIFGSLHLLSFNRLNLLIGLFIFSSISYLFYKENISKLRKFFQKHWKLIIFEELVFGLLFIIWSWVRSHQPDINGLEKFMDFGFVNSLMRTDFFPPADLWLAGETINYYYFGHLYAAVLTKLTGVSSSITYNLMIALILALSFVATFSLASSLAKILLKNKQHVSSILMFFSGLVSAVVLTFGGNLHAVYKMVTGGLASYWYPDATRYIPFTIHEFPLYSFVVSDLHGHVSNIPFVLLTLALFVGLIRNFKTRGLQPLSFPTTARLGFLGLMIGVLYMTSALDAPIYFGLLGILLFVIFFLKLPGFATLKKLIIILGVVVGSAFLFTLPFHFSFTPFAKGIFPVNARSSLQQLLVLWGFFLIVGLSLFIFHFLVKKGVKNFQLFNRSSRLILLTIIGYSALLVIVPEFIYIKDIYIEDYHRANTMFKLVYQTFLMMSVVTGPVLVGLLIGLANIRRFRIVISFLVVLTVAGLVSVLIYPKFAINSYYNGLKIYKGLDGVDFWFPQRYPNDYEAIVWLRKNIAGQPVILEAVGESYTDFSRVSTHTGLPTVLGWRVHEWLWRGSFDEPGKRTADVETIYTSANKETTCDLMEKYNVDYIFVGALEREQYTSLKEQIFQQIGDSVFTSFNTSIYQIRRPCGLVEY